MSASRNFTHFLGLLIADLIHLSSSFILSHPLYFSYVFFFSPYLFKILSFLSPLLLTTFFVSIVCEHNFSNLLSDCSNEGSCLEDLGLYELLFGSYIVEEEEEDETIVEKLVVEECTQECNSDGGTNDAVSSNDVQETVGEKRLENFLKILDQFEKMATNVDDKKKGTPLSSAKTNKVVNKQIGSNDKTNIVVVVEADASINSIDREEEESLVAKVDRRAKSGSFGALDESDLGSMRKEKEWKRTLAGKLYEERHNVGGSEGMDSLWEAYEIEANDTPKDDMKKKTKTKTTIKEIESDDEDVIEGPLCCLQAIKFSTGKMNLGVGRPSLVKITKAIKGIGWLHKHSKKVHNNGDRLR